MLQKRKRFFLWVFDSDSKVRISGTLHLGINKESLCLGFSLTHTMNIEVGILAHNNKIGDFCDIDSVEIKQQQSYYQSKKPISLEPNQSAILNNNPDHWEIVSNQDKSTPGCRYSIPVVGGKLHAISVDIEVNSESAATFLWAYSRSLEKELLPRVHVFRGGPNSNRTKGSVYLEMEPRQAKLRDKDLLIGLEDYQQQKILLGIQCNSV